MLKRLVNCSCFKKLDMEAKNLSHAYLFYSPDRILNNDIAQLFAMKLFCEKNQPCFDCDACKRNLINKNPDFVILDNVSINVEDVSKILDSANFKPMIYPYKIVLIKNAENINEIAQNKLLKAVEEPASSLIFILTTTNEDKLLTTIRSRLKKIYLSLTDIDIVKDELLENNVNVNLINSSFSLTEMLENSNNEEFSHCLETILSVITKLDNTQNIPDCVNELKLNSHNKILYINLMDKLFSPNLEVGLFNEQFMAEFNQKYSLSLKVRCKEFIEKAYKQLKSNVNPNYVFDTMFYSILKEKYLSSK